MSRESDLQMMTEQAYHAFQAGQQFFTVRLKIGGWGSPSHGELPAWGENLEAIERAGWRLHLWSVSSDASGSTYAYPVFRRGDGTETALRDRPVRPERT